MAARSARRRIRRSFTLVEMLVVVVIIGILAGMITGAALIVQRRAKMAVMRVEIGEFEGALTAFKEKFGDYPPDGTDPTTVVAFLKRAFPNYRGTVVPTMDPSTAMAFWLGGRYDTATGSFSGFSANPRDPFDASASRIGPFYDGFQKDRLVPAGTTAGTFSLYRYLPNNGNLQSEPLVYFRARANATYAGAYGNCKPCLDLRGGTTAYANAKSFQIRSPGLDGRHGGGVSFPTGDDYDQYQYDDVTNITERTLGDAIP